MEPRSPGAQQGGVVCLSTSHKCTPHTHTHTHTRTGARTDTPGRMLTFVHTLFVFSTTLKKNKSLHSGQIPVLL